MRTRRWRRVWADAGNVDPNQHARVAVPLRRRDHRAGEVLPAEGAQHGRVVVGTGGRGFQDRDPGGGGEVGWALVCGNEDITTVRSWRSIML